MMQLVWLGLAFIIGFTVLMISSDLFETWTPIFYICMLGLCLITIFVAPDIKGSRSWLVLGPIRLQPAEFTKMATALLLAWKCNQYNFEIKSLRSYLSLFAIVFVPILMILAQNETGSALVFFALFLALYREGFTGIFMGLGVSVAIYFISTLILNEVLWWGDSTTASLFFIANAIHLFTLIMLGVYGDRELRPQIIKWGMICLLIYVLAGIAFQWIPFDLSYLSIALLGILMLSLLYLTLREYAIKYLLILLFALGSIGVHFSTGYVFDNVLQPHQQVRIKVSLGITSDPRGDGYNVDQAKIAIGSGGLWGKGFLEGTQSKLSYVPEQDTDFIFCTVGEEEGFVGSSILLILYTAFILRLAALAERQTTRFGRVYGNCIAAIFFFHILVNVGMVLGIVPVIGIPLPFFSYGGSSLWGFSIMLFIFLGIDARRHNKHL